jgi:hypothetical protein
MVDTITIEDDGLEISIIEVGIQGPSGVTGAKGDKGNTGDAGADGAPGDTFLDKPIISPVLGGDYIPIVRAGTIYLALVSDVLNAQGITPPGSQLKFSLSANSALSAGVM